MKQVVLLMLVISLFSCQMKPKEAETQASPKPDVQAELASIEQTRAAFQLAIKEGRYGDLRKYATPDVKSLTPDCGDWGIYKTQRANPQGKFHYDSLVMRPTETVLVSDSVAYDFGMSSTYYTNAKGESVELKATFLAVLKKDKRDGVWKLHREVANTRSLE
ncbi:DUF4440 domain-containing protein [Saccharicrinis sp. FJH54]|uniref:DUF4440 domain-containing protein n=1 Tax=Saccharicrinis sp. FJH54 TaxID=3344665 RepID=UPI0035D488D7